MFSKNLIEKDRCNIGRGEVPIWEAGETPYVYVTKVSKQIIINGQK